MKKSVCWLLAILITLVLSVYQRMTGPTHPKKVTVELNGESYKVKLPRSGVQHDEIVKLKGVPSNTTAQMHYRRYPTSHEFTTVDFCSKDDELQAALPVQPVGGKLQYYLTVGGMDYAADEPIVIRFRNDVPAGILVPHILLMFAAMPPDVCGNAVCRLYFLVGSDTQGIRQVAENHGCYIVCRRFHLRSARAACGLRTLVDWFPLRNRPYGQQDPLVLPVLCRCSCHIAVEVQQMGGLPCSLVHDRHFQHSSQHLRL